MKLDHIGWITNKVEVFESFWVDILGFKRIWESHLTPELTKVLFGIEYGALCRRYQLGDIVIEIHQFDKPTLELERGFVKYGINHIALHVKNRKKLIQTISAKAREQVRGIKVDVYHNPGGWDNIFIHDFEGNWIELRETFK